MLSCMYFLLEERMFPHPPAPPPTWGMDAGIQKVQEQVRLMVGMACSCGVWEHLRGGIELPGMRSILCRQISGESIRGEGRLREGCELGHWRDGEKTNEAHDRERVEGGEFRVEGGTKSDERWTIPLNFDWQMYLHLNSSSIICMYAHGVSGSNSLSFACL